MIRLVAPEDAKMIMDIYNHYVLNTGVTFEEDPISLLEMRRRIKETSSKLPWFVFEEHKEIIGYAYASNWKSRIGYRLTVESSVYLKKGHFTKGIGSALYAKLLDTLQEMEFHSVIGGVALPNPASIKLHEKFGFIKVAQFKEVGIKFDKWMDVAYWQLQLK